jgi:AcrR family transcriptional regulator
MRGMSLGFAYPSSGQPAHEILHLCVRKNELTKSKLGKGEAETRILLSAAELFAISGYNGVSTRDIAVRATVSEVTIYRHYARKRDLYLAVLNAELEQVHLRGDLLAGIADASDGRMVLERTFDLISSALLQRQQLLRLIQFSALELGQDVDPMLRKHLGELVEVIARYLEPWVSRGQLRCRSAKSLVLSLIAIILSHRSLHRLFLSDGSSPGEMFMAFAEVASVD